MPDANALTYKTLQDAVLGNRFPQARRPDAKRWLATAYQDVWSATTWQFHRVTRSDLAVTTGDSTPAMPADYADTLHLFDDQGEEIPRVSPERFELLTAEAGSVSGLPTAFMVANRQIHFDTLPSADATFKHSYRRRLASRTAALAVQAGMMALDDDYPLWDDHHALLVPRGQAIGLQEINDPTWQGPQTEYERQLDRMIEDYQERQPTEQWGGVWWEWD